MGRGSVDKAVPADGIPIWSERGKTHGKEGEAYLYGCTIKREENEWITRRILETGWIEKSATKDVLFREDNGKR